MNKIIGWLEFYYDGKSKSGKTDEYIVLHKDSKDILGEIKWSGNFRQYTFSPESLTYFSRGCLRNVATFIDELMDKRKK
jgi:hypothetical protein